MILTTRSTSFAVASCCMTTSILSGDWRCVGGFGGLVVQLRYVCRMRWRDGLVNCPPPHSDADERRYSRLLHRHSVDRVCCLGGGAWVVRDDDKLRLVLETVQHSDKVADVLVVERSIYFVQQAERTRLREKNSKEER